MIFRLRKRWKSHFRDVFTGCVDSVCQVLSFCRRDVCLYLSVGSIFLIIVWMTNWEGCQHFDVEENVCNEFSKRDIEGHLCGELCSAEYTQEWSGNGCYNVSGGVIAYTKANYRFVMTPSQGAPLKEGSSVEHFLELLEEYLKEQLGELDHTRLIEKFVTDFDFNDDHKLTLGEASSIWRLVHQPDFLPYYIFQVSSSVPHFNGSCGGLSLWHEPYLTHTYILYDGKPSRWTMPSWVRRAKAMMSLLELADDLYEMQGVRYHLCNMYGHTLYNHPKTNDVLISRDTMLFSAAQIELHLKNITCTRHSDCLFTQQCQTTCDYSSGHCTSSMVRPTMYYACQIMDQYIMFDVPAQLRVPLTRLVRRCLMMGAGTGTIVTHSTLYMDMKNILWHHIQNLKVK